MVTNKVGRPVGDTDARERLIREALRLFVAMPYGKVSTRLVARHAGVNVALISYYFGNKAGLFETVVRETAEPMWERIRLAMHYGHGNCIVHLLRTYYQIMAPNPDLPKLMVRCMMLKQGNVQREIMDKIFRELERPTEETMFDKMKKKGSLSADIDPHKARLTFISMMVFPFLLPPVLLELYGFELNEEFLMELADHNAGILTKGLFG